jgi:hypothetical protein
MWHDDDTPYEAQQKRERAAGWCVAILGPIVVIAWVLIHASLTFGAGSGDWSEIMRPEAPAPLPKAAVREPDETHPPAGKLIYRGGQRVFSDGMWFTVRADGSWEECVECNAAATPVRSRRVVAIRYIPTPRGYEANPVFEDDADAPQAIRAVQGWTATRSLSGRQSVGGSCASGACGR